MNEIRTAVAIVSQKYARLSIIYTRSAIIKMLFDRIAILRPFLDCSCILQVSETQRSRNITFSKKPSIIYIKKNVLDVVAITEAGCCAPSFFISTKKKRKRNFSLRFETTTTARLHLELRSDPSARLAHAQPRNSWRLRDSFLSAKEAPAGCIWARNSNQKQVQLIFAV